MIPNPTVRSHPEVDGFPSESGSSEGFVLMSQGVFVSVASALLLEDLVLYLDFCMLFVM